MKNLTTEIKWAILFTLMTIVWILIEKFTGLHSTHIDKHPIYTNLYAIPAILIYVLALREKKQTTYLGHMTYLEGFVSGVWLTLFATVLAPFNQYFISAVISPDFFPTAIAYAVSSGKMSQEAAESYFSLKNYLLQSLIGTPIMGVLTTAIVAVFLKSKKGNF